MKKTDRQKALECLQTAVASYPDQRVGQVIANIFNLHAPDLFYVSDEDFSRAVVDWLKEQPVRPRGRNKTKG